MDSGPFHISKADRTGSANASPVRLVCAVRFAVDSMLLAACTDDSVDSENPVFSCAGGEEVSAGNDKGEMRCCLDYLQPIGMCQSEDRRIKRTTESVFLQKI